VASTTVGYSGTPLPQKLGIKRGHRVLLDGDPEALDPAGIDLDPLPDGVVLHHRASRTIRYDVVLLFAADLARLEGRWTVLHPRTTEAGALWVCWPKKAAKIPTDLNDNVVREYGLAHGRVDVLVAAVSVVWSGQKFVIRLADRS
jgi:hypothetical protein